MLLLTDFRISFSFRDFAMNSIGNNRFHFIWYVYISIYKKKRIVYFIKVLKITIFVLFKKKEQFWPEFYIARYYTA